MLFLIASDFTVTTRHIHSWELFLPWLILFIPSWVISLFFSGSILDIYWLGGGGVFIFQCHIFLALHTIQGVLKARMLQWFAIPFSSGPRVGRGSLPWSVQLQCSYMAWLIVQSCDPCDHFGYFSWLWFSFCMPSEVIIILIILCGVN